MSLLRSLGLLLALTGGLFLPEAHAQIESLPRPDSLDTASFGVSVAIGDSIAVVGASGASVCGDDAGAVFVYERRPGPLVTSWSLSARLVPRDCHAKAFFGADVALDGSRILVSAFNSDLVGEGENAAYIFERTARGTWTQAARLTGLSNQQEGLFAAGVALDGDRAVVSTSGNPEGAYNGAAYVFERDAATGAWSRTARLSVQRGTESGVLGRDVALDGNHLAVAASTFFEQEPGSVYVFRYDVAAERWRQDAHLKGIDAFFIKLDLQDSTLIVGEDRAGNDESGAATVYTRDDTTWTRSATLRPSIPYDSGAFGSTVSLQDGRALITGYDEQLGKEINIDRVVYVFQRQTEGSWQERTILDLGTVDFGAGLDQNSQIAIISSVPKTESGTAYIARLPQPK
ncbi:MAG: hypothetical protein ABEL04_10850 [Salinibacter sp.]|uniref:hypothetical protein n=1 Tax=Salinibacter sp. TaxID=2065818 RepID=UPI0035D46384